MKKTKSLRNKTLTLSEEDKLILANNIYSISSKLEIKDIINKTFNNNFIEVIKYFPSNFADLLIIDPPYNLTKNYNGFTFKKKDIDSYITYLKLWLPKIINFLKPTGSLYICADWNSSYAIYNVLKDYMIIRNRITWQREKGRGAKSNWKNVSEDIWYATKSNDYYFDVDSVKLKKKVLAPYKENGKPKDWKNTKEGKFRLTYPSNFMNDITVPYWSMSENTYHPTQKPEKLIAKLILASCPENGIVCDPFLGSGTTSVVAKKLNRKYCGIELNKEYCLYAEKRLQTAIKNNRIQGYCNNVFLERNAI